MTAAALAATEAAEAALALTGPAAVPAMLAAAHACLRAQLPDRAATLCDAAAAATPTEFAAMRSLSGLFGALGRRDAAIDWGRRATAVAPADAEARLHLAGTLLAARHPREAAAEAERHLALTTTPAPLGWRILSAARLDLGDLSGAVAAAEQAVAAAPAAIDHQLHLASVLGTAGQTEAALRVADAAVAAASGNAMAARVRSGLRELAGDLAGALADIETALRLQPGNAAFLAHREVVVRQLGLAATNPEIATPPIEPLSRPPPPPPRGLRDDLAERGRVIHAIALREVRTRHAGSRLGYAWALVEPIGHLATLGTIFWLMSHGAPPIGDSLFLFYITGLLPYLMFSHTAEEVTGSREGAGGLFHLPVVGPLDVAAARGLIAVVTDAVVAALVLASASFVFDAQGFPADLATTAMGFLCLWAMGLGAGLVGLAAARFVPGWSQLWNAAVRLLYFASGIYYSALAMPGPVRDALAWNPVLQGIEWFRVGFYAGYSPPWFDPLYAVGWAVGLLLLGLCLERAARPALRRAVA